MNVTLAAMGGGDLHSCTWECIEALKNADLLLGSRRLLDSLPGSCTPNRIACHRPLDLLQNILDSDAEEAVVVYSGDTGFYSGARFLVPLLEQEDVPYRLLPGVSSVQLLASKLGEPWQNWNLVSAHGVTCNVVAEVMRGKPTCFLTGGQLTPDIICQELIDADLGFLSATVGSCLTSPEETVETTTVERLADMEFPPMTVLLIEPAPSIPRRSPGIPDSAFLRGDVPLSKQPVRAAVLSQMAVHPDDVIWDVGAGTGGVSVELALAAPEGRVYAVERNPEACELIKKNRRKFCAWNLTLVEGDAPEALLDLPVPDKVFIGGSGGEIRSIIETALEKNSGALICADAIAMETLNSAWATMQQLSLDPEILQVYAARTRPAGTLHLLLAGNPTFIITGNKND